MTAVKTVKKGDQTVNVVEFKNQYSTTSAKATVSGSKLLEGRELEADEFTFKLFASNSAYEYDKNNALQSVKNAKDGKFSFEELSFDAAGIYYYVVAEDTSVDAEGITFDESIYLVKIEVKDNGKGALVADDLVITKKGSAESIEEITFKYVFTSKPSVPESPKTGDNSNVWLWFILILASGFVIIITGYELKRTSVSTEE